MYCLNFYLVQFLVLFLIYLVDVLSQILLGPVRGLTPVIFGVCVVWTFVVSSSWFYSCYIWCMCCLKFVGSCSWSYSCYIWLMYCLNLYVVQLLILFPIYLVYVLSQFCRVQLVVLLPLYLVYVLSELLLGPVPSFTPNIFGGCVV